MNFRFTGSKAGKTVSEQQDERFAYREKERANGKWFWIFKRAAAWLTLMIVMFGAVKFYSPETITFDGSQIFVALFMFGGFFAGTILEWSKMEKEFHELSLTND